MTPEDPWKQRPCPRSDHRTTYKQGFGQFPKAGGGGMWQCPVCMRWCVSPVRQWEIWLWVGPREECCWVRGLGGRAAALGRCALAGLQVVPPPGGGTVPHSHPSPRACTSQRLPRWSAGPQGSRGLSSAAPQLCPELHTTPHQLPEGVSFHAWSWQCSWEPGTLTLKCGALHDLVLASSSACTPLYPTEHVSSPGTHVSPFPRSLPNIPAAWQVSS